MSTQVVFSIVDWPATFSGTQEDFKTMLATHLAGDIANSNILTGRVGGVAPSSDVGPWADRQSWKTWDNDLHRYIYNWIAVGNKNTVVYIKAQPTADRSVLVQDKNGIAALTDDLFTPRQSFSLVGPALSKVIDWNASNTFYDELQGNTVYDMQNSRHGQKIYVAIMNPSTYTVAFTQPVGFIGGVQPVQSKAVGGSLTDVTTVAGSKLIRSGMAQFITSDEGLGISTAGNDPIPAATTIFKVLGPFSALLSNAAINDGSGVTATIASRPAVGRTDLWVFKNVGGSVYGRVINGYPGLLRVAGSALSSQSKAVTIPAPPAPPTPVLLAPQFDPSPGHENLTPGDLTIAIITAAPAVAIRYTTDGTIPTSTTGNLVSSTVANYTLAQGDSVEITAIAVAADGSVSPYKRALYSNVYAVPDTATTASPDNADTGQARMDVGSGGGLIPTKTQQ